MEKQRIKVHHHIFSPVVLIVCVDCGSDGDGDIVFCLSANTVNCHHQNDSVSATVSPPPSLVVGVVVVVAVGVSLSLQVHSCSLDFCSPWCSLFAFNLT